MDDVELADAVFTHVKFNVVEENSVKKKVNINQPLDDPEYQDDSKNQGLRKRHRWVQGSRKIVLLDRLHQDLFQQEKFIPN